MENNDKVTKGIDIRNNVEQLEKIAKDHYNYSLKQIEQAQEEIIKLWDTCEHSYQWINTDPYSEVCKCKYCGADSPRTRKF